MNPRYGHVNAVDFDDLILLTLRLFTEHPEALEHAEPDIVTLWLMNTRTRTPRSSTLSTR